MRARLIALCLGLLPAPLLAEDGAAVFNAKVRPILADHCLKCHSTQKQKGDLDLERFTSYQAVKQEPAIWENVVEQLHNGEMPPKKEPPLPEEKRESLTRWAQQALDEVALANAGDPGPVVLRRLSNMEYTYSLRDLTGVASLDPAREFPTDGAAGEGFTNASAALVMSPALLNKFFDAAKGVSAHAVLTPIGIRFSPHTTGRDWTDETLARIREFYAQFSESGGATAVNLQGVKFDTNHGGRVPVLAYFSALIKERDALRDGKTTIADVAAKHQLNAKYASTLWAMLNNHQPSLVLDEIRGQFRSATPGDAATITTAIQGWQTALWRFASVGHIGKLDGPKGWQEPVSPLGARHELRLKLSPPKNADSITLYLTASAFGAGADHGAAIWSDARLVIKGAKDKSLRDVPGALPEPLTTPPGATLEIKIPAELVKDAEFVVAAQVDKESDDNAAIQVRLLTEKPTDAKTPAAISAQNGMANGKWSDNNLRTSFSAPILVRDGGAARIRLEKAFDDFRAIFPAALCYTKIVPVDEVVTLTLFYREDEPLKRLMLDEAQIQTIDRLWDELRFVSEAPLKQVDVFEQLWQFATQDADPKAFEPLREPITRGAADFKKLLVDVEPKHVQAVIDFAARAWRRPLSVSEETSLRSLYQTLRQQGLKHPESIRQMLSRVLVAPAFLYRNEQPPSGQASAPVNDWALATRLSYFIWSSTPDDELMRLAANGTLHRPEVLSAQTRRMLQDPRVRRLATEFGCQYLHVRDVATLDEKSERHFPTFISLRESMQEEPARFFIDLFQANRSVLSLLDADYTFVNGPLAKHYGIAIKGDDWRRVDSLRAVNRGGILGFAATLSKEAGASRTSPILRGNWLSEVVIGEKLPRPPKGVPLLPEVPPNGLTERQLIERHSTDPTCAKCHQRIDPLGFALEGFDAIGHARSTDSAGLPINTKAHLLDGTEFEGVDGLRNYLLTKRRDDFVRQFSRKLLGFALGRSIHLSDKPLLDRMVIELKDNGYKVGRAIDLVVQSRQFREIRGRDYVASN